MTNYDYLLAELEIETDDCQIWPHARDYDGYGLVWAGGKLHRVHRLALQLATGEGGEGLDAAHRPVVCHNPACFNPRHLAWKSRAENCADKVLDGTNNGPQGEAHGHSKLNEQQVRLLMALWDSGNFVQRELAKIFDVTQAQISNIVNRKRWAHLWA